jgi:hypothetical protein
LIFYEIKASMPKIPENKQEVLEAIKSVAKKLDKTPSRAQFISNTGISEYQVLKFFQGWREAVRAAGLSPDASNIKLEDADLLEDWGALVRKHHQIPTRAQYRKEGTFSPGAFESHFGPWSIVPFKFKEMFKDSNEWRDVLAILPETPPKKIIPPAKNGLIPNTSTQSGEAKYKHSKLEGRPVYGDPIDFRGLRHEPVNEQGVVFLFGMVARELGYMVEAVQTGFPDCEAKRQLGGNKWQRIRIEFEFESRNFRDHGHPEDGCDVIVCWRHNWPECPPHIEVLELKNIIQTLSKSDD